MSVSFGLFDLYLFGLLAVVVAIINVVNRKKDDAAVDAEETGPTPVFDAVDVRELEKQLEDDFQAREKKEAGKKELRAQRRQKLAELADANVMRWLMAREVFIALPGSIEDFLLRVNRELNVSVCTIAEFLTFHWISCNEKKVDIDYFAVLLGDDVNEHDLSHVQYHTNDIFSTMMKQMFIERFQHRLEKSIADGIEDRYVHKTSCAGTVEVNTGDQSTIEIKTPSGTEHQHFAIYDPDLGKFHCIAPHGEDSPAHKCMLMGGHPHYTPK